MRKYVIVDLEMCPVAKEFREEYCCKREIIQIGAVLLDKDMKLKDRFNLLVKPEYGWIDSFIENLTGISQEMVNKAPMIAEAMERFLEWIPKDAVMVSWSMADKLQFTKELQAKGLSFSKFKKLSREWIDCQKLFSEKIKATRIYSLEEAMLATDITGEGRAHDGLCDAVNTASIFTKLMKEKELKLNKYYELIREDKKERLSASLGDLFKDFGLELKETNRISA